MRNLNISKAILLIVSIIFGITGTRAQDSLLLKDYDPISVFNVPKTTIAKAKYPIIDFHSHPDPKTKEDIETWVRTMKEAGVEKSILLTYATGKSFDSIYDLYSQYKVFDIWCGFDYTGYNEKGWSKKAIKELERCFAKGAKGIGELGDKGEGLFYSRPSAAYGMHIDDERMQPLLRRCGELGMPISVHVADPYWMYLPMDEHNDGLMNAHKWKIDTTKKNILMHGELIKTLENAVKANPGTTFIACHLANCSHDLSILGNLFDSYPNLYGDFGARFAEIAPVPRRTKAFFEKYQDRLVYGTDMGSDPSMYQTTFRILESEDEHFYEKERFSYHWPLNGLGLSDETLRKIYNENGRKILK